MLSKNQALCALILTKGLTIYFFLVAGFLVTTFLGATFLVFAAMMVSFLIDFI